MANVTLKGNPIHTVGELPAVGSQAPDFTLVKGDLAELTLASLKGQRVVLNIFPSIDTGTCAASVRNFNQRAAALENTLVINVSMDLPFAMTRFCGAEGIDNVDVGSAFRSDFGQQYGVTFVDGPLTGLFSRAVVVLNEAGQVLHIEQVSELVNEPDYDAALAVLS